MVRSSLLQWLRSDVEWRYSPIADGLLRLPLGVGDNLQLPPNAVPCVPLWGSARNEEAVLVAFLGKEYRDVADRVAGRWKVCLDTTKVRGGPFTVDISSGGNRILLRNVMVGHLPSHCLNDARETGGGVRPCAASAFLAQAVAYWHFANCATAGSALARQEARFTGSCDRSGFIGEGWRFGPNQFMFADRVSGIASGNTPHSVAMWAIIHNITSGDVPLASLGAVWQPSFGASAPGAGARTTAWDYEAPLPNAAGGEIS
ncbi:hypothetical protein T484DRAFT_1776896 [Baffinella frigidus]|nr:hypothetical protein T484DRAFT_1776896 [Cryptophyta sp. CCMP2293]